MCTLDTGVLRLGPGNTAWDVYVQTGDACGYGSDPSVYLDGDCSELPVGSVLLVPTYRLEEVEEIIEPEKPGVPVEPYVGLSWEYGGTIQTAVGRDIAGHWIVVYFQDAVPVSGLTFLEAWDITLLGGYPHTPSTPAVTRKVKKWVKIEHPEVSFDGLA